MIDFNLQYKIAKEWNKFETIDGSIVKREPPKYVVPNLPGIHYKVLGKGINEVQYNTLEYILYYLHNVDYNTIEDTTMALYYYYIHRIRNPKQIREEPQKLIRHYNIINEQKKQQFIFEPCVYLMEICIGSKKVYKIGKTTDLQSRYNNLLSSVKTNYSLVSVAVNIKETYISEDIDEIEKEMLIKISSSMKNTKFYFKGHTESFESEKVIDIYRYCLRNYERSW